MQELKKFNELEAKIAVFVSPVKELQVRDSIADDIAVSTGKEINGYLKQIETIRVDLTKPLRDQIDQINEAASRVKAPLEKAMEHLRFQRKSYALNLELLRKEEEQRIAAAAEAERKKAEQNRDAAVVFSESEAAADKEIAKIDRDLKAEERKLKAEGRAAGKLKSHNVRKVWKFEVENEQAVPREFLTVDTQAIRKAVSAGTRVIPGVRIFEDAQVAF